MWCCVMDDSDLDDDDGNGDDGLLDEIELVFASETSFKVIPPWALVGFLLTEEVPLAESCDELDC